MTALDFGLAKVQRGETAAAEDATITEAQRNARNSFE